jgi:hypothetical protein
MRALLAASVALGALAIATGAGAATKVGDGTQPIQTKTVNNGNPDDIDLTGTLTLKSGTAVTLNSNNSVTVDGGIAMNSTANGSTGILAQGGQTGSITNNGTISVTDGSSRTDTVNHDGIPDGPWATGEHMCAICVAGSGVFTGNITNGSSGQINVTGNDSFGISIGSLPGQSNTLTGMVGNLSFQGGINIIGDNNFGIINTAPITGTVTIAGSVNVQGANSVGVALDGDISGRVVFGGSISSTGYSSTTAPVDSTARQAVEKEPSDVQQGGSAVVIGANMAQGVLFDEAPTASSTNPDVDGDGVADTKQTNSSVTVFGSAPAIQVGSTTQTVTLGEVGTTVSASAADYAFGLILKGAVSASGVYTGKPATGVEIGVTDGVQTNQQVTIDGGIRNAGTITVSSQAGAATGIQMDALTEADLIRNDGTITASSIDSGGGADPHDAIGILLQSGAHSNTITNSGTISAVDVGIKGAAIAIQDLSGTVTDIENRGIITAVAADPNAPPGDEVAGREVAIDAHSSANGVTIHQFQLASTDAAPSIHGAIFLGAGADTVDIEAGSVSGLIAFGTGADNLIINGGSTVTGGIFQGDGGLSMNIVNGTLTKADANTLNITNLNLGAKGVLVLTIDPTANSGAGSGGLVVSGAATLADGASFGVRFTSLLQSTATYDLVTVTNPANLTAGNINTDSITKNTPFLFVATPGVDLAAGTVSVTVRRRTATEAGMIPVQAALFNPFYTSLGSDEQLESLFLQQTTSQNFFKLYDQMLPDHSGAPLLSLASGVDAVSRALADRRPVAPLGEITGWAQEINFYADKQQDQAFGFRSNGFGLASGFEWGTPAGSLGTSLAFTSSDMKDNNAQGDENLSANMVELGVYWRETGPHLRTWARAAGGYAWFNSIRQFVAPATLSDEGLVVRRADSSWDGYSLSAAAGMSYEADIGRWFIRPEVTTEYFYLSENGRSESGGGGPACTATLTTNCGGDAFDLGIGARHGHYFTASALMNIGGKFGADEWLQPELHFGWTQYISVDPGVTQAHFLADPSQPFNLFADSLNGGGPVVGFRLLANGAAGFIALEGDADLLDMYKRYQLMIRAGYRF